MTKQSEISPVRPVYGVRTGRVEPTAGALCRLRPGNPAAPSAACGPAPRRTVRRLRPGTPAGRRELNVHDSRVTGPVP